MVTPRLLEDLPPEFESLRSFLVSHAQPYINLAFNKQGFLAKDLSNDPLKLWETKVGGLPYLPKKMEYPCDRQTGEMMMFLLQINCADVPSIPGFKLPSQGLLQFYSSLNVPMCVPGPEPHRIIYFPEISQDESTLVTDFSFTQDKRHRDEWYHHIYTIDFSVEEDVFWDYCYSSIPDNLIDIADEFDEWFLDYKPENEVGINAKMAGFPEFHSYVPEVLDKAKGQLLLEFNHPFHCSDYFYFYIEEKKLIKADFSGVKSYFMRA